MESDLCLPPLDIRRRFLASKFWLKAKSITSNKTIEILDNLSSTLRSRYWRRKKTQLLCSVHTELHLVPIHNNDKPEMFSMETWVSNIDLTNVICDSIPSIHRPKRSYNTLALNNLSTTYINQQYENCYKIFTDGSKDGSLGGAAFLDPIQDCHVKLRIDSNISIMHIELIAIAEALAYITSIQCSKFVILTDSKSSLQHLARCTSHTARGVPIAYYILESILRFQSENREVFLQWIPSHVQMRENEAVDLLARQATSDGIPLTVAPLSSDYTRRVKEQCVVLWQEYFDERSKTKGIWYRTIQPTISKYPWFSNCKLCRNVIVIALRTRSAHLPTNKFAYLMKKSPIPTCADCRILRVEDVQHLLLECERNASYRKQCFNGATAHSSILDVGVCNSILAKPESDEAIKLYNLIDIGLKTRKDLPPDD